VIASQRRESGTWIAKTRKSENVSGIVIELVRDEDLAEEPVTSISTPLIYLLADPLHPLPLYKDERRQTDHSTGQRRAEGARNDRPRRTETAPRGAYA
jgi:hypothetical protein